MSLRLVIIAGMMDYGITQEALAERIGKNQSTIANKLRILKLSRNVQKMIVENDLTERHARALLKLGSEDKQLEALSKIIRGGLTVRQTEDLIEDMLSDPPPAAPVSAMIKHYIRDIRILTNTIKENLEMVRKSGIESQFDMVQTDNGYDIHILLVYGEKKHVR